MQTEFTCRIYTARYQNTDWYLKEHTAIIGFIKKEGDQMYFVENMGFVSKDTLRCVYELMLNIEIQYKQLQTI